MIVPMKKVSVVTLKTLQQDTLNALRDLGVLHVFADRVETDRGEHLREQSSAIERALATIPPLEGESAADSPVHGGPAIDQALQIAEQSQHLTDEQSQLQDEADRLTRDIERFEPWGGIDPQALQELSDADVDVALYEVLPDQAETLIEALPQAIVVDRTKSLVRVVGVAAASAELPTTPEPMTVPAQSMAEMRRRVDEIRTRRSEIDSELATLSPQRPVLLAAQGELASVFEFVRVQATMDSEKELTWITGFLPHHLVDEVREAGRRNGWGIVIRDPDPDEQVPTQIRNPKPVRIVQPVFDLLGTVPGYREIDISLPFLLFFIVFFAMIIGDGGYGSVLFLGTVAAMLRGRARGKRAGVGSILMLVLSLATVVWGAVTGNWFGYEPFSRLPVLRDLVIPAIAANNDASTQTIQYMTFVIGTIHLALAHLWNFVRGLRQRPFLAAFEQLGWLMMVLGLYYLVLELVLGSVSMSIVPRPSWWLNIVIVGFAFVIVFGQQQEGQNFFVGVGKGVANLITTALDGISAFSDIISYIRLFAVGLATLAIANAFNSMAAGISDSLGGVPGAVIAALILFLGHTLNLAMGALSVIVHGVRLNMLEFSQHLGMEWTGVEYAPFKTRS